MCTLEKRGNVYILTLTGNDEHRLNPTLLDSIRSALRRLRSEPTSPSSVLITTAHGKFFSNGYDLSWARSTTSQSITSSRYMMMSSKTAWSRIRSHFSSHANNRSYHGTRVGSRDGLCFVS
ncbi:hypothetical protein OIU76_013218 [Salix suchowensis]|nr:hypothetical protein OIU76_013218 [Salix suchowensis]